MLLRWAGGFRRGESCSARIDVGSDDVADLSERRVRDNESVVRDLGVEASLHERSRHGIPIRRVTEQGMLGIGDAFVPASVAMAVIARTAVTAISVHAHAKKLAVVLKKFDGSAFRLRNVHVS